MEKWGDVLSKIVPVGIPMNFVSKMTVIPVSGDGIRLNVDHTKSKPTKIGKNLRKLVNEAIANGGGKTVIDFHVNYDVMMKSASDFATKTLNKIHP